jgi:hypothetical protein
VGPQRNRGRDELDGDLRREHPFGAAAGIRARRAPQQVLGRAYVDLAACGALLHRAEAADHLPELPPGGGVLDCHLVRAPRGHEGVHHGQRAGRPAKLADGGERGIEGVVGRQAEPALRRAVGPQGRKIGARGVGGPPPAPRGHPGHRGGERAQLPCIHPAPPGALMAGRFR